MKNIKKKKKKKKTDKMCYCLGGNLKLRGELSPKGPKKHCCKLNPDCSVLEVYLYSCITVAYIYQVVLESQINVCIIV